MTRARNISNPQAVTLPLTVSPNITSNASLAVGNTAITGTLTASANVNFDSGTLFVDGTNNRVGINNAAPTQALTVTGNIFANGAVTLANSTGNTVNFFANNRVSIGANAAWGDLTLYGTSDKFISVTSTTGSTTKVGIDLNPSMSVSDATSSQPQARIYSVDSNYGASIVLANKSQGALGNSLVDRVVVSANGKVGIANSSPSNTLHITGTMYSSGNTIIGGSSVRNVIGYLHEGHGSPTLGAGIRELFRVGSWSLSSSGFFSMAYTRGNVVHNSMWTWVVNHAGRAQIFQLGSATYTGSTIYIDDDYYGSVIVSVDHGAGTDQGVEYTVTTYVGTLDMGNVNTLWSSNASNYYRTSMSTSGSSMKVPNMNIVGSLSKGSGTFDIEHPLDNTKRLRHSFIEGPRYDLIYRGKSQLTNGQVVVNLDTDAVSDGGQVMTEGTFVSLTRNPSVWLQNETSWDKLKYCIEGSLLTIDCQNSQSNDFVSWMVVAERKDTHVLAESNQSDTEGRMILEYDPNQQSVMGDEYVYPTEMVSRAGE